MEEGNRLKIPYPDVPHSCQPFIKCLEDVNGVTLQRTCSVMSPVFDLIKRVIICLWVKITFCLSFQSLGLSFLSALIAMGDFFGIGVQNLITSNGRQAIFPLKGICLLFSYWDISLCVTRLPLTSQVFSPWLCFVCLAGLLSRH